MTAYWLDSIQWMLLGTVYGLILGDLFRPMVPRRWMRGRHD